MYLYNYNKKGFTLIELMVTVLIIGILAAIAGVSYSRFLERMRMAEAEYILGHGVYAEERYRIKRDTYTKVWHYLDSVPRNAKPGDGFLSEDGTVFYTKGSSGSHLRNGFSIYFQSSENDWFVTAKRTNNESYKYTMVRPFAEKKVYCIPSDENDYDQKICMDFMGAETVEELPADPRPSELRD